MIGDPSPIHRPSTTLLQNTWRVGQPGGNAVGMTKVRHALGEWGERLATAYLIEQGMVILDRNWRTSAGEIDIVARDVNAVIFCEVKTRRGTTFGDGAEAVTDAKTRRLRQLALQWLATSGIRARSVRFDVVSVLVGGSGAPVISHIRDAF